VLGNVAAGKIFEVSRYVAYYWKKKITLPSFHPDTWGGPRNCAFDSVKEYMLRLLIKQIIHKKPVTSLFEIQQKVLQVSAVFVNKDWIARLLRQWGYSWKKPESRNRNKFTIRNMLRWLVFTKWIKQQPRHRIKYLDEVHFEPKSIRRRRGIAPIGYRVIQIHDEFLSERYSMILMTHLDPTKPPATFRLFDNTVDSLNVMAFLFDCIRTGQLVSGDILVMDNAAIHFTNDLSQAMIAMLSAAGVTLKFLPTYSPELNPCELVFGLVKNWIRNNRGAGSSLFDEIVLALSHLQHDHLKVFY